MIGTNAYAPPGFDEDEHHERYMGKQELKKNGVVEIIINIWNFKTRFREEMLFQIEFHRSQDNIHYEHKEYDIDQSTSQGRDRWRRLMRALKDHEVVDVSFDGGAMILYVRI